MILLLVLLSVVTLVSAARWGCLLTVTVEYHLQQNFHPTNNSLMDTKLLAIGNLLAQTLRVLQYPALMYGLCHFSSVLKPEWEFKKLKELFKHSGKRVCFGCHTGCLSLVLLMFTLLTWAPPIILMVWFDDFAEWHEDSEERHSLIGYTALAWLHHLSDLAVRLAFFVVTVLIMSAWNSGIDDLQSIVVNNTEKKDCQRFG